MKKDALNRLFSAIASVSLLANSLLSPFAIAYAQEATPTPEPTPVVETTPSPSESPILTSTPEPTQEPTSFPIIDVTPTPEVEVSPTPTIEVTPEPAIEATPTAQPEDQSPTTTAPPEVSGESTEVTPTPTITTKTEEKGEISAVILNNTSTSSIDEFDLTYQTEGSATISTDKLDYAPTDTVFITGSGFIADKTYTIIISSSDDPAVTHEGEITADSEGKIIYSYQLDGNYRPNYKVEVKDGETLVATTTFTDGAVTAINIGTQSGTLTHDIAGSATFIVSFTKTGSDTRSISGLSVTSGLPTDALPSWSATSSSGSTTVPSVTLTINISATTPAGSFTFRVSSTSPNLVQTGTLVVSAPVTKTTPTITFDLAPTPTYLGGNFTVNAFTTNTDSSALTYSAISGPCVLVSGATFSSSGAGTCVVQASGAATTNFNAVSNTQSVTIAQASSITTVTCGTGPFTYNGSAQTPCTVSVRDAGSLNLTSTADYTNNTNAGTATASYTYTGDGNHTSSSDSKNFTITKADAIITVTPYSVTYDGNSHTTTGSAIGAKGESLVGLDLSGTTHTNSGSYPIDPWTFTDVTGNYNNNSGTVSDSISSATALITVTPYSVTYDGNSHIATVIATGAKGEDLSGSIDLSATNHTDANDYPADAWSFHDAAGNYADTSGSVHNVINKADAIITVTPYSVTYDGNSHTTTGSAIGAKGESLVGLDLSGTTHTNSGSYPIDPWTFTDVTGNYNNNSGTVSDSISSATALITVTPYSVTYDGNSHIATVIATGAKGEDLSGSIDLSATNHTDANDYPADAWSFHDAAGNYADTSGSVHNVINKADAIITVTPYSVTYDGNSHTTTGSAIGAKGESLVGLDLSGTTHTNSGSYPIDPWTFTDVTGNYNNNSGTVSDSISSATALITVTPYSVTYDGNSHIATVIATGAKGEDLSGSIDLSATNHTDANDYPADAWSFHDAAGNYADTSGSVHNVINKADAIITVTPYSVTYDGNSHTTTGSAIGAKGESLVGLDLSGTTHTNSGSYPIDPWTFTDVTGNYNNNSGTVSDSISSATALITVTPYSVTYDGNSHIATVIATGAKGEDLSGSIDLSATNHTDANDYPADAWSFHDAAGNYADTSGSVHNVINKADAIITVTPYSVTYDGNSHTTTGSAIGAKGESLVGLDLSGTTHTNSGSYPIDPWTFTDVTGNYNNNSGTVSDSISSATALITVTPYSVTYDGNSHIATVIATGAKGEDLSGSIDLSATNHTDANDYPADAWSFHDAAGNYADTSGSVHNVINKADAIITVTPYSVTYDGNSHTTTGSAIGAKGESLVGLDLSGTTHTNSGSYPIDPWTFTDVTGNYNNNSGTVSDSISSATALITVTPYSVTYDGNSHIATVIATGAKGEDLSGSIDLSATNHTDANDYPADAWSFHDAAGNYADTSGSVHNVINKADAIITVTPYSVTYDGNSHTTTGSAIGAKGESLVGLDLSGTTHTNSGSYPIDPWTFTDVTGNYNNNSGTVSDSISSATALITVTPYSVTYDGNSHIATVIATGAKGEDLSGSIDLSATNHTDANDYPADAWSFHDAAGNYADTSGSVHNVINKADAIITVTPYSVTYDGNSHTTTGSAIGAKGESLVGLDLSGTTHTNSGSYPIDPWTFTDVTGNYNNNSGTVSDSISSATALITVTPYSVTYDGNSHIATVIATGAKGEDLSGSIDLSATNHTDANDYPADAWSFHDAAGNYADTSGSVHNVINKADAIITVTPYSVTYDGNSHTTTGSAIGAKGESLVGLDLSGTTHTNSGSYPIDPWTFTDVTGNYNNNSGTVSDSISSATALITVTPYSVTYDGNSHIATVIATGAKGEDLSGSIDLSATNHTDANDYPADAWSFHDAAGNYADTSGSVHNVINKADAIITVTPYSVTYDGNSHTTTGSAIGAKGESLVGLDLSGTTHTNSGSYPIDPWTFTDVTGNYNNNSGTVSDSISSATALITVTPYSVTYDGNSHIATVIATGAKGEDLSGSIDLSATNHTDANDYPADAWSFHDAAGNYADTSGSVHNVINKADAIITVTPYSVTYDGNSHTTTGSAIGAKGESLVGLDLSGTTHTNSGSYPIDPWTFTDVTGNYNNNSGTVSDSITKADQTISFAALPDKTYGDPPFSVSATTTSGLAVTFDIAFGPATILGNIVTITGVGTVTVRASQIGDVNYNAASNIDQSFVVQDKIAPTGFWIKPIADSTVSGIVDLEVSADDIGSGVADVKFQYKRNDEIDTFHDISTDSTSPYTASWDTNALPLDEYTLNVVITDNSANSKEVEQKVNVAAVVSNEESATPLYSTAVITWITDRPTQSRVIYDTIPHPTLGIAPNYGYVWSTGTSDTSSKVLSHSVTINGLSDGVIYYYRTISEGSPITVGDERSFKTLSIAGSPAPSGGGAAVLGISSSAATTTPWISWGDDKLVLGQEESKGEVLSETTGEETTQTGTLQVESKKIWDTNPILFFITHKKKLTLLIVAILFGIPALIIYRRRKNK